MSATVPHPPPTALARLCLSHAAREEAALQSGLDALREIYAALRRAEPGSLAETLRAHESAGERLAAQRQEREQFCREAGTTLGLPCEAVTLRAVAARLPEAERAEVLRARERLRRLAAELDRLRRDTAALTTCCLETLTWFFTELTGGVPGSGRYGPSGAAARPPCGPLFQARG